MACPFEATANTEAELMKKVAAHAAAAHNMKTKAPDMVTKVKNAIKK